MASLELSGLRLEINRFQVKQLEDEESALEEEGYEESEPKPWMRQLRKEKPYLYLLKKLRSRKTYRIASTCRPTPICVTWPKMWSPLSKVPRMFSLGFSVNSKFNVSVRKTPKKQRKTPQGWSIDLEIY